MLALCAAGCDKKAGTAAPPVQLRYDEAYIARAEKKMADLQKQSMELSARFTGLPPGPDRQSAETEMKNITDELTRIAIRIKHAKEHLGEVYPPTEEP